MPALFDTRQERNDVYIHFILPLSGRYSVFKRFMKMYVNRCIREQEETKLLVVLYKNDQSPTDFQNTINLFKFLQKKYPTHDLKLVTVMEPFSRGKALQHGVNMTKNEDLLLFIDVDIVIDNKSLVRIRRNTVQNQMVYFPIVYSMYNPKLLNNSFAIEDYEIYGGIIDENQGYWRQFGFGIVSLYKSDYLNLGGFDTTIVGWGFEDVNFYDNAVKSNLSIVRSVDPGMIHVYHPSDCDSVLEIAQKNMCIASEAHTLASLSTLQRYYKKYRHLFNR